MVTDLFSIIEKAGFKLDIFTTRALENNADKYLSTISDADSIIKGRNIWRDGWFDYFKLSLTALNNVVDGKTFHLWYLDYFEIWTQLGLITPNDNIHNDLDEKMWTDVSDSGSGHGDFWFIFNYKRNIRAASVVRTLKECVEKGFFISADGELEIWHDDVDCEPIDGEPHYYLYRKTPQKIINS